MKHFQESCFYHALHNNFFNMAMHLTKTFNQMVIVLILHLLQSVFLK